LKNSTLPTEQIAFLNLRTEQIDHLFLSRAEIQELAEHYLPILLHQQDIQTFKELENPAHGWLLGWFTPLIRNRSVHFLERMP
jgi:hypothetical protein